MRKLWLFFLLLAPSLASAAVMVCESQSHPVSQGPSFNPQGTMSNMTAQFNTQVWHCNNGVSGTLPTLLKRYHLLHLEPFVIYNISMQPPYKQGAYGLAVFNTQIDRHKS